MNEVQFISVAQLCLTLCNPMNHSTPGFPVHHQLPEFTQTHIHQVRDAIQPSHPGSSPSPPAPSPSQHQNLFQWVGRSLFLQSSHLQRLLIDWIMPPASHQLSGTSLSLSLFSFLPFHSRTNFLSISHAKYLSLHFDCLAYEYFCQSVLTYYPKISRFFP